MRYLVVMFVCALATVATANTQPNIVFIFTDDQQFNALGVNGNALIETPTMDALARRGVRFSQARAALPVCSPSRACIVTGQYNSQNGVEKLGQSVNADSPRLAVLLKNAGYATGVTGKWHLGKKLQQADLGFDYFATYNSNGSYYRQFKDMSDKAGSKKPKRQHVDAFAAERAVDFIDQTQQQRKPFFLWYNSQTPHLNGQLRWDSLPHFKSMYRPSAFFDAAAGVNRLPRNWNDDLRGKPNYYAKTRNRVLAQNDRRYLYGQPEKLAQHTCEYYAVVSELDHMLKPLIHKLQTTKDSRDPSKKLIDTTYVFFMSDNGWMMGDHGMTSKSLPFDQASRVPFFVFGPGVDVDRVDSRAVSNIDLAPTFLEIAGAQVPKSMNGKSVLSMLHDNGQGAGVRDVNIVEILEKTFAGNKPILGGFDGRYEVFYTYEDRNSPNPSFTEVYDLDDDPWELNNLATQIDPNQSKRWRTIHKAIQHHRVDLLGLAEHPPRPR